MGKKFKLIDETITNGWGVTLSRIVALKDFGNIKAGEKGGFVEKEENLSHENDCWVFGNAEVYGYAKVYGNAEVWGNAEVYGDAKVCGNAEVWGNAEVYGDAKVCGNAEVYGYAKVYGNAEVYGNALATTVVKTFGNGFNYGISVTDKHIKIGCQQHLKSKWLNFSDKEILKMDGKKALEFWRIFKPLAISLKLFDEV